MQEYSEQLADLLFEIGKHQSSQGKQIAAIPWLEGAYFMIRGQKLEDPSSDASELHMAILYSLVKSLMKIPGEIARLRACNIVDQTDSDQVNKLAVLSLRLDLLETDPIATPQAICAMLLTIIRSSYVTDSIFKTIMHYVHKLRPRSSASTHLVLNAFLSERILDAERPELLDSVFLTMVWNLTTSLDFEHHLKELTETLDTLGGRFQHRVGSSAAQASQIVSALELNYLDSPTTRLISC